MGHSDSGGSPGTLTCDCQAYFRLATVEEGVSYVLKITGANHVYSNHPVDTKTARVYPENRKPELTKTVQALAGMNIPSKSLKSYIENSQGICLLPQDVVNMKRKMCGVNESDSVSVERLLGEIREEGGTTKIGVSEKGEFDFEHLFFVTAQMRDDLRRFCDVLVMDATYKMMGEQQFKQRMAQLEQFLAFVTEDTDFTLVDMTVSGDTSNTNSTDDTRQPTLEETNDWDTGSKTGDKTEDNIESTNSDTGTAVVTGNVSVTVDTQTVVDTDTNSFSNVKLHKIKTRGRPRNVQNFTRHKKRKLDKTVDATTDTEPTVTEDSVSDLTVLDTDRLTTSSPQPEQRVPESESLNDDDCICIKCGVRVSGSNELDDCIGCQHCSRKFHRVCVGSDINIKEFTCDCCLPAVNARMSNLLSDYERMCMRY
ncbi:hypothetical protein EGW08_001147 [Elysia chlorotica]|uniref:Uncharacterized protein n=1 Tax=Elysia chlorotica TaxID=188477 RepID=A0A433UBI0_ELYCH|nr:hypothetical protein EGW08_001147 [Elysia chlorotica]